MHKEVNKALEQHQIPPMAPKAPLLLPKHEEKGAQVWGTVQGTGPQPGRFLQTKASKKTDGVNTDKGE